MRHRAAPFLLALIIFALDRISKVAIKAHVSASESVPIIPGFFNIVHAENPGVAFSFLADTNSPWRNIVLIAISTGVMIFIIRMLLSSSTGVTSNWILRTALGLVLGGALGNLFDRIVYGTVTDFLEVYAGSHYFPAFNVADSAISIGAGLLLLDMWRGRSRKPELSPKKMNPDNAA
jgi:signal peptidase II